MRKEKKGLSQKSEIHRFVIQSEAMNPAPELFSGYFASLSMTFLALLRQPHLKVIYNEYFFDKKIRNLFMAGNSF